MSKNTKILDVYFQTNTNYEVRTENFNDKEYLVVPVIMMVEGVHSGSHGPILHYADELGRYPESWDGIPVTIGHPKVDGQYVSANSPDVLTDWAVGIIFNTRIEDDALKAEAWLCIEDLERVSEDTLEKINNNEIIEVSVGIFSDEEDVTGVYNNEQYIAVARNHRPNHLALLPDEIGACSIEDGCGIRVNKKGGTKVTKAKKEISIVTNENQSQVLRELNRQGLSVNEMGQFQIAEAVREAVYALDGGGRSYYVDEIFDDYVIYAEHNWSATPTSKKLYQRSFEVDAANQVKLIGEAVQVKKDISYVVVSAVNANNHGKVQRKIQKNSKSMCTECVKNLVNGLIANKTTAYSEDHREQLEALPESLLEIMSQNIAKKEEPVVNTKVSRADIISVLSENPLTQEEYLKTVAPEVREQYEAAIQLHNDKKKSMVASILKANEKAFTEDELNAKPLPELQKIYSLVAEAEEEATIYAGGGSIGGASIQSNAQEGAVMLPPGVKVEED